MFMTLNYKIIAIASPKCTFDSRASTSALAAPVASAAAVIATASVTRYLQ